MNPGSTSEKPVRLRERLKEATCEAILEAAERAFAQEGPKARMESIAARAGIAVGTLYNHFADREALWRELCRSRREALLVRIDEALDGTRSAPFEDALAALIAAFVAHWSSHRGFLAVLLQTEPLGARSPRAGEDRSMAQEMLARLGLLVARGVKAGALRPEGADLYPALLLGLLRSVLYQHLDGAAPADAPAEARRMVQFFLHGAGRPR